MSYRTVKWAALLLVLVLAGKSQVKAATGVEDLRAEVEDLRKRIAAKSNASPITQVDKIVSCGCEEEHPVKTRNGKLEIGGLLQIWDVTYYLRDHQDVFGDRGPNAGSGGTSETQDNGGYSIRRAELRFKMDIHENITSVVMIDPSREATSIPPYPSNQGLFKSQRTNPSIAHGTSVALTPVGRVQSGAGSTNRMLQDAYINYHGAIPHHDITIGQFKPAMGEEGVRNSAYLDFAERAMVTQLNDLRDLGIQAHGTWYDDRLQYWAGVFNGTGNFFGTANAEGPLIAHPGGFQNRSDDNSDKDVVGSILGRPFWNWGCIGSLELGVSGQFGKHGESGGIDPIGAPVNGLNRRQTSAIRDAAWIYYKPMGFLRGLWVRGEYGSQKDRTTPLSVDAFDLGSGPNGEQTSPHPFKRDGFYASTGYKLTDSVFADRLNGGGFFNNLLQPVEFAFRYEQFGNVITESLTSPDTRTDIFQTKVVTVGVNYYVKAYNSRIQVNYSSVDEPGNKARNFHEVKNDVLIFTYQLAF
jgi:hypothetical protein